MYKFNRPYLTSRMFRNCVFETAPDEGNAGGDGGGNGGSENEGGNETPTVEELMTQLAVERAAGEKNKLALDKALKANGELQKKVRDKMSAEEQATEAREAKEQELRDLKTQLRSMEYSKNYMGIGIDNATAESLAKITGELEDSDTFFKTLGKFIDGVKKQATEDAVQAYLKDNPNVNAGGGRAEKNAVANEMAKKAAAHNSGANMDILKHYISGGI